MDLSNLKWLIGQWEGIQGTGIYHEEWETTSESEFKGKAYMIRKGEISNPEKLKLHSSDSDVYYTADVGHNPEPVSFKLTSADENIFVFENPGHDFPKKITYQRNGVDELVATISDGKKKIEFKLSRVKS